MDKEQKSNDITALAGRNLALEAENAELRSKLALAQGLEGLAYDSYNGAEAEITAMRQQQSATLHEVKCSKCGQPTMHIGTVCYSCCHAEQPNRAQEERDILAKAIRDAAVKAGICRDDVPLTGPDLLLLLGDLTEVKTMPDSTPSPGASDATAQLEPVGIVKWQLGGNVVHLIGDVKTGDLLYKQPGNKKSTEEEKQRAVVSALIDADHLAECSERLLAALNRKAGAMERVDIADVGDADAPERARIELEQAEEAVSEYWRAVRSATYEYRKRAERARTLMQPQNQATAN